MAKPAHIARMLWDTGGEPLTRVAGSSAAPVPGVRPISDQAFALYSLFIERYRDRHCPIWHRFVPTSATFDADHKSTRERALEALRTIDDAVIIEEFGVDVHIGASAVELIAYVGAFDFEEDAIDLYFMPQDASRLVAYSHHETWFVIEP
ncbi:MAG: hypothetical protein AAGA92_16305 [Planctomycetota bacterium]